MGVAYYGNFLAFFETGRVEAMRQIGADYASVVLRGVHLVVVEATVRYRQPREVRRRVAGPDVGRRSR
jgi:acyl-CoA thioester hydrolase